MLAPTGAVVSGGTGEAVAITVDESFDVAAPPDHVWAYLIDPARVVTCLPGAELIEAADDRNFTGRVKLKVGPVTASFRGRATFEELDPVARRVRMTGKGQETAGGSSATMNMTSEVTSTPSGGSHVRVSAEVEVVGKLMQFGRGMMEEVSRQVFGQFAACVRATLEAEARASSGIPDASSAGAGPPSAPAASLDAVPLLWKSLKSRVGRALGSSDDPA